MTLTNTGAQPIVLNIGAGVSVQPGQSIEVDAAEWGAVKLRDNITSEWLTLVGLVEAG